MKTGKKIAVLALIFVAAAIIYFVWPLGRKEENKTGVVYTAMSEAELPVVYPTALGRELAPLFGHREELAVTAERDSLLVLPEDRRLPIRIQYGDEIKTLQYEIRTMDMTHLVERTTVTDWTEENGQINAVLPVRTFWSRRPSISWGSRRSFRMGPAPGTTPGSWRRTMTMRPRCWPWRRTFPRRPSTMIRPRS